MNPKNINDLDPKLKETYERVMGTSFAQTPTQAAPQPQQPLQTVVEPTQPPLAAQMAQPVETPISAPEMVPSPQMTPVNPAFTQTVTPPPNVMVGDATAPAKKKNAFLMPVLFVVGGVIFFVAYAVIWAKVFGLF
jgi:hypothetical protein